MAQTSTILIVDDEPVGRDTLEALLINQGYVLTFAANGMEALALAHERRPDLVLLDVMMPDMDGFEVCRRLRADPTLAEVPVIMVTALDDRDSRLRGIEVGADDFCTKPYDRAELRTRVRTITRLDRYRRLWAERARLEWVVEQATDGYLFLGENDEVLFANPQARVFLGLSPTASKGAGVGSEPVPLSFLELAAREYRCEPQQTWTEWREPSTSGPQPVRYLVRPESPTASALWLRVDLLDTAPDAGGERIVRLRDVTSEVAQQRDIRSFHDALRHKIRTPFQGILASLELLQKSANRPASGGMGMLPAMALASAKRLHAAFEDILQYIDAAGLAQDGSGFVLEQLQPMAIQIGNSLGIQALRVLCPQELANKSLLLSSRAVEVILWELLENSVKFHPSQSPTVEVSVLPHNSGQACLQVMDDGVTISPEHLGRVWTPYYQAEKYFTGEAKGMGLGLATVAAFVWEVGGTCQISSRKDRQGVVVELTIPVADG